jgi:hypothetical protein
MATAARQSLKIGMLPADGIGREVLPVSVGIVYSYRLIDTSVRVRRLLFWLLDHPYRKRSLLTYSLVSSTSRKQELHFLTRLFRY